MEDSKTVPYHHSTSSLLHHCLTARLAGLALVGAALMAFTLTGCGPSSGKTGKQSATNAAALRMLGRTNQASPLRPGLRTNLTAAATPATAQVPPPHAAARTPAGTNRAPAVAGAGMGKNASLAKGAKTGIGETLRNLQNNSAFYPAIGVVFVCLCLAVVLIVRMSKAKAATADKAAQPEAVPKIAARPTKRKARQATTHTCNVLYVGSQSRQVWQFGARGKGFELNREQTSFAGEPLPARLVARDWHSLFQRKLNIAWLPPERVFLRVAQFPTSDFDETVAMVELQLEKLSPMAVTQIVWSICILPHAEGNLQTVVVMIVSRNEVEEFLGQLEGQGFLADRLELPLLDQLQATTIARNGAWIYPEPPGGRNAALVAWWYGGVLQNLDLITLPPAKRPESLKEQLLQMAWAGELEGWLTAPPAWHLVADAPAAAEWEPALRAGLEQPIEVSAPVPMAGLAALTAARAAHSGAEGNLLPAEFSTRYHQRFVDRLWMRSLGAVVLLYVIGVLVYFARLQVELYRTSAVEGLAAERGPIYTNALQLKAKFQVLKDRQDLKFAALDCWKVVAELLPDGVTLDGYTFSEGKKLTLSGSAPADQTKQLLDFDADIRKVAPNGQLLFDSNAGDHVQWDVRGNVANWHCVLELKRSEAL
jgi:Na+-transporting methylmalonyl-CoA/oxaloacetate decarboxylase gamma subunit